MRKQEIHSYWIYYGNIVTRSLPSKSGAALFSRLLRVSILCMIKMIYTELHLNEKRSGISHTLPRRTNGIKKEKRLSLPHMPSTQALLGNTDGGL